MIELTEVQKEHNASPSREVALVFEMLFTNGKNVAGKNDFYFSTHPREAFVDGAVAALPPPERWYANLDARKISSLGQSIDDASGVSSISGMTIPLPDVEQWVSDIIKACDEAGYGLNRQLCDMYILDLGDSWDDKLKLERQQICNVRKLNGVYVIETKDVQRAAREKVMVGHEGLLAVNIDDVSTSLSVVRFPDGGFPFVAGSSALLVDDEAIKVTEAPVLSLDGHILTFNNLVRHAFGTTAAPHDAETNVKELPYLIGNQIDIAMQLLSGFKPAAAGYYEIAYRDVYAYHYWGNWGGGWYQDRAVVSLPAGSPAPVSDPTPVAPYFWSPAPGTEGNKWDYTLVVANQSYLEWVPSVPSFFLPDHWHAGMSVEHHINLQGWSAVQDQIAATDLAATDIRPSEEHLFTEGVVAKTYIEQYIFQPMGLRMFAQGDGRLGLLAKKDISQQPVPDQASQGNYENRVLDLDTVISWGDLELLRDGTLMSTGTLSYDRVPRIGGELRRNPVFFDSAASEKHGKGRHYKLEAPGLISSNKDAVKAAFIRTARTLQRYASPPRFITVKALPMMAVYNIGDDLRVRLPEHDPLTGQDLNQCFEILERKFNPSSLSVDFTLISQTERGYVVPRFKYESIYADSAFLDGLDNVDVPAARNLVLINPGGNGMALTAGDWFIPSGDGNVYTMSGTWTLAGSVRVFCSGEIYIPPSTTINGVGRGGQYDGYASVGAAGTDGQWRTVYERGERHYSFKYPLGYCVLKAATGEWGAVKRGRVAPGSYNPNAGAFDIVAKRKDNTGKVTALAGVPNLSLAGARGGRGADGIDNQTAGRRGVAARWAITNGFAFFRPGALQPNVQLQALAPGEGGAGLLIVARRVVCEGDINLAGGTGSLAKAINSARLEMDVDGCNNFETYQFRTGASGAGGAGALVIISEADPLKGIHLQNANLSVANGYAFQELI